MIKQLLLPLVLGLSACTYSGFGHSQPAQEREPILQNDLVLIRANLEAWLTAFNAKDIDALMALYDPQSAYANANAPLLTDLELIRVRYAATFDSVTGTLRFKEEKAIATERMGLLVGKYYFEPPVTETKTQIIGATGRVALVYRKNESGAWKLLFDMDNTPPDVSPEDFD